MDLGECQWKLCRGSAFEFHTLRTEADSPNKGMNLSLASSVIVPGVSRSPPVFHQADRAVHVRTRGSFCSLPETYISYFVTVCHSWLQKAKASPQSSPDCRISSLAQITACMLFDLSLCA